MEATAVLLVVLLDEEAGRDTEVEDCIGLALASMENGLVLSEDDGDIGCWTP